MAQVDWDWSATTHTLDTTIYMVAPASLKGTGTGYTFALSKGAALQNLAEGRIIQGVRVGGGNRAFFLFRNQAALGSCSITNTYFVYMTNVVAYLVREVGGVQVSFGPYSDHPAANVWTNVRVTWWTQVGGPNDGSLAVQVEGWDGSAWVDWGTLYDSANQWASSNINRVGSGLQANQRLDETYIYSRK